MVSSWLLPSTEKSQDTSGVEAIKSLLRSLNLNRARLPGTLTFRDEPPGPDKSLCEIVSRISNSVDIDSKSINERTIEFAQQNTVKNDSQESCNLNSRTESAIQSLSTRKTNDEKDDVIYSGKSSQQNYDTLDDNYSLKLIQIHSGNCGTIYKRANLDAESLETIRKWGSARSLAPKIGDISNGTRIESNDSQKKVVSTYWPNTNVTSTSINFNNELWPNSYINSANIFDSKPFSTTSHSIPEQPRERPAPSAECLENTSTQTHNSQEKKAQPLNRQKANTLKKTNRSLSGKLSHDRSSIDIDTIADGKKLKEAKVKNPYHRIHLSINNYFNSPHDSPLISPKVSKLHGEVVDGRDKKLSKKNIMKVIAKRKSLGRIIRRQQIKKIPTTNSAESDDTEFKYRSPIEPESHEVLNEVDVKITSDKGLSDNNHPIRNNKIDDKTIELNSSPDCLQVSGTHGNLNLTNSRSMDCQRNKPFKMDHMKTRLEAVLSGERRTVAKPSEILIPHSVRARHIFSSFANIPEQPESRIQSTKNIKKKSGLNERNQNASTKTPTDLYPMSNSSGGTKPSLIKLTTNQGDQNPKQIIENYTNASFKHYAKKHEYVRCIQSNVPVLRSRTCIVASKNSDITKVNNGKYTSKTNTELNETIGEKKFNNRHSKSLRILKQLLANTDESIAEESVENSEEKCNVDESLDTIDKCVNNIASQTSGKSEMTQSLHTVSEDVEQLDASTETDGDRSLYRAASMGGDKSYDEFPTVSTHHFTRTSVDAQVSCSFPKIVSLKDERPHTAVKTYRMIETQTSRTSCNISCKEKRDTSVETVRLRLQSKYVNTERCVLIDSSTGKDVLEIQNFCCDTQLTNTESTMFNDHSVHDLKVRINGVESQVNALKSMINIGFQNTPTDIGAGLISSLSHQIISQTGLTMGKENYGNSKGLPEGVMRAFEIAAEKAQNLHRAIEIYREHEMKKQNELKNLSGENQKERMIINLLREEKRKSQSLIVALEHISESEKALQEGLTKLVLHQEVQFTLETLIDQVVKEAKQSKMELKGLMPTTSVICDNDINAAWICDLETFSLQAMPSTSSTKILPIVYGAVCTLIFWSLQFSTSCEFG